MSNSTSVKFGLINPKGFMNIVTVENKGDYADRYVFSHPSYTVTTSFNRNHDQNYGVVDKDGKKMYYTRLYRKSVLWDFGDGTTIEGQTVSHSYKKPGRYRITCTFFDIERKGYRNDYFIYVVVKEVLPTELHMMDVNPKTSIKCSKIEKIQEIEAVLNNRCKYYMPVVPSRIITKDEENEVSYFNLKKEAYTTFRKHWTFLKNTQTMRYRTNEVYADKLEPTEKYYPRYDNLYGSFYIDSAGELKFRFYFINAYSYVDEKYKTIKYVNPDYDFLSGQGEERISADVQQVYLMSDLDTDAHSYVGARSFIDIFYKSDYISEKTNVVYAYDLMNVQSQPELLESTNWINQPNYGQSFSVVNNDKKDVKWSISLDGFLHFQDDNRQETLDGRNEHIDIYADNGFIKDRTQQLFLIPYITYFDDEYTITTDGITQERVFEYKQDRMNYYVPKDLVFDRYNLSISIPSTIKERIIDGFDEILNHVKYYSVTSNDDNLDFMLTVDGELIFKHNVSTVPIENIAVPLVKQHEEDFEELMNVYMPHKMFQDKDNLKDALRAIFKKSGAIDYITTYIDNYFDNFANYKTCYVKQLISILHSLDEDVKQYEVSNFDGVNELRDFVRLLSINHSTLVGHRIDKNYDIRINGTERGENVGDQLYAMDSICIGENGCIDYFIHTDESEIEHHYIPKTSISKIIVHDKYTQESRTIELSKFDSSIIKIADYKQSWLWNLLLPERFDRPGLSQKDKAQIIDSYYDFYLLNPAVEQERVGNFIDSNFITEEIEDVEKWNEPWGITYTILMKILDKHSADAEN